MKVDSPSFNDNDEKIIINAVEKRQPLDFFCYTLNAEQKERFQKILKVFLDACDQDYMYSYLSYCLLELLDNASKANSKRIFFKENHLNINDKSDYESGMKAFKEDLSVNPNHYINELQEGKLQVHLQLSVNDVIVIKVTNNTKITDV